MSLIIILTMIVALGVVFADNKDKEGCPCNPQPQISKIKETSAENTKGNVQPLNTCMRYHIEYRNCSASHWTWRAGHVEKELIQIYPGVYRMRWSWYCTGYKTQQCDKYGVWYNNCTHQVMYEDYLGRVTRYLDLRIYQKEAWHPPSCP